MYFAKVAGYPTKYAKMSHSGTNKGVEAMLEVEDLTKNYGDFQAVKGVSFRVNQGEIFGFLGPNGAGKTTTINMLTGLAKITRGRAALAGMDCSRDIKKAQGMMGIVPDESNLYDELSGFENLCFCGALYGMEKPDRERRAGELLKEFGLADTGARPFKAYSKGMKRKLTIAAGLIHQPKILFLDEPTTGIDVASARQIRQLILKLNREGATIFLTTHYIEEAERLCARVAFIVEGAIVRLGTIGRLMQEAQEETVIQFSLNSRVQEIREALEKEFPKFHIEFTGGSALRIRSPYSVELFPFMDFFRKHGLPVYEAKLLRPSLEDVFVKVTGIESHKMVKEIEKGGGKK